LDRAAAAHPDPGRRVVHRLNRAEYVNAVRDLLDLDTHAIGVTSLLPPDDSGYGFDNIADVLTVSPVLLERYMSAARKITRLAVGDPTIRPGAQVYEVSRLLVQNERMSEDLPFGSRGGAAVRHYFPLEGDYVVRVRLARNGKGELIGVDRPQQIDVRIDHERIQLLSLLGSGNDEEKPSDPVLRSALQKELNSLEDGLEARFHAKPGLRLVQVSFLQENSKPEGVLRRQRGVTDQSTGAGVGSVIVEGPYDVKGPGETPSRQRIFSCRPTGKADDACARKIISGLARRAYRQPVNDQDLQDLLALYRAGNEEGGFEAGIGLALQGILTDTSFLFRVEKDPAKVTPGKAYPVSDLELASRLSFFLWSSIPDEELLTLAEHGKLRKPGVLDQQVRRMLQDPRSEALIDNFVGQWLYLRNMRLVHPDPDTYPEFNDNLRKAFQQETKLFFESMFREDRSIIDLLTADYTYLNERLARHYGIPNVYGSDFRRVKITDENRKGLLGQGSVLTVTSYPTRTAPTLRGKWLLENIMGTPPPPPPPNVPALKEDKKVQNVTMRERMEQHRTNPVCASCHSRMDPLGFAMENFDAVGKWRTTVGDAAIDASGAMPDGTKFIGPAELRRALLGQSEQFVHTFTEKLLTYALGRGTEHSDAPAIRAITRESAAADYRWSAIISGIVKSTPFQMRRSQEP
jgi:hypothetical protein